jgi:hypothetical protein
LNGEVEVHILAARSSDHNPVLVHFDVEKNKHRGRRKIFKYEVKWALEDDVQI